MEDRPIRLALLGAGSTGKTSLLSRLTVDLVHEVHYPTRQQSNWLFEFNPKSKTARALLDGQCHERLMLRSPRSEALKPIFGSPSISPYVLLSPLTFQSFMDNYLHLKAKIAKGNFHPEDLPRLQGSHIYNYAPESPAIAEQTRRSSSSNTDLDVMSKQFVTELDLEDVEIPPNYLPPFYEPIPIDIIDTPAFNPDMVVPFLEVSLFRNLDKSILQGLADEPRQPVSTTSLLVASGASELNGKVDGYIYVYSAVPELNHYTTPPSYGADKNEKLRQVEDSAALSPWAQHKDISDGGFHMLDIIRNCILDAWTEFRDYKSRWEQGKEDDVYSLMHSFKNIWKNDRDQRMKIDQLRTFKTKLDQLNMDPSNPNSPPPCIIVCTHLKDPLSSPVLVDWGKALANDWKCGFVAIDSMDNFNIDVALSLLIKDISERNKLMSSKSQKGKQTGSHRKASSNGMLKKLIK